MDSVVDRFDAIDDVYVLFVLIILVAVVVASVMVGWAVALPAQTAASVMSVIFALISTVIAILAFRTSRRRKEQNVTPTLVFDFVSTADGRVPAIVNVGNGPALKVGISAELVPESDSSSGSINLPYRSVLDSGEHLTISDPPISNLADPNASEYTDYETLHIRVDAIGIDGNRYDPHDEEKPFRGQRYDLSDLRSELTGAPRDTEQQ